ncbi:MAG: hypothetical protein IJH12_08540 [Clostridia bacterium]|nr:hypothetical protein [Clostridia bacterium]
MKPHRTNKEKTYISWRVKNSCGYIYDVIQTKEREYKREAQKKYRSQQLNEVIEIYLKIYFDKQINRGQTIEQIAHSLTDSGVRESIIGKAKLDIAIRDNKARKENKSCINPNNGDLEKTLQRYYNMIAYRMCVRYKGIADKQDIDDKQK